VWDVHGKRIERLFDLFQSIYIYIKDFVKVVADLRDGVYLQQTVEGVLLDDEGKQVMCECLYLYGVLLLLLDARIDGAVRDHPAEAIVAALLFTAGDGHAHGGLDEACRLGPGGGSVSVGPRQQLRGHPHDGQADA
jgi:WASH complex subunit strumpellin